MYCASSCALTYYWLDNLSLQSLESQRVSLNSTTDASSNRLSHRIEISNLLPENWCGLRAVDICAVLACWAADTGPLKMEPIGCPDASVRKYYYSLR